MSAYNIFQENGAKFNEEFCLQVLTLLSDVEVSNDIQQFLSQGRVPLKCLCISDNK